jgi:LEA14-like dessication related protein
MFLAVLISCTPKEEIIFKGIKKVEVQTDGSEPILTAEALFSNPNNVRMKLKEVNVEILVDGKPSAKVQQKLKLEIPAQSDFSVSLTARLSFKDIGLIDTIINLIGGKKYQIQYIGFVRVAVHGITVKVPVKFTEERRIRL